MPMTEPPLNPIAAQLAVRGREQEQTTARVLARYLDEWLRIPGTQISFGLDPILALFPGIGDLLVSGAGGVILLESIRSGIPFTMLLRMALNMTSNFLLGLIPGAGAFFTAFFKSNTRNLRLLQSWQAGQHQQVRRSTLRYFMGLVLLFALLLSFLITLWLLYSYVFYHVLKSTLPPGWL
jgi:hypothetical protein